MLYNQYNMAKSLKINVELTQIYWHFGLVDIFNHQDEALEKRYKSHSPEEWGNNLLNYIQYIM